MSVVGELGNHDQTQIFSVGRETLEGIDFAAKFNSFLAAFNPMAFVVLTDDMQHLFTAQPIEVGFVRDEQFLICQARYFSDLRQENVMGAVLDVLQKRLELRAAMIFQFEPPLRAAPGLVRPDVTALFVSLGRSAA